MPRTVPTGNCPFCFQNTMFPRDAGWCRHIRYTACLPGCTALFCPVPGVRNPRLLSCHPFRGSRSRRNRLRHLTNLRSGIGMALRAVPNYCGGAAGAAGCSEVLAAGADSLADVGAGAAAGLTVVVVEELGAGVLVEGSDVGSAWSGPLRGCGVGRSLLCGIGVVGPAGATVDVLPGGSPTAASASRRRA